MPLPEPSWPVVLGAGADSHVTTKPPFASGATPPIVCLPAVVVLTWNCDPSLTPLPSRICAATPDTESAAAPSSSSPDHTITAPPFTSPVTFGPIYDVNGIVPAASGTVISPPTFLAVAVNRCAIAVNKPPSCHATMKPPSAVAATDDSYCQLAVVVLTGNSGGSAWAATCNEQNASMGKAARVTSVAADVMGTPRSTDLILMPPG